MSSSAAFSLFGYEKTQIKDNILDYVSNGQHIVADLPSQPRPRGKSVDQTIFAAFAVIGMMFVLVVTDAVSIALVNADTAEERRAVVARLLITRFRYAGIELWHMSRNGYRDPMYLFGCHLEWCSKRNLAAYSQLVAALAHADCNTRMLAEVLLSQTSLPGMPAKASSNKR